MTNILVVLSHYLFNSFGLSIIVLTIVIRFILLPLSLKQLRSSKAMQDLQPKIAEIQKKYAKDKQKLSEEQMKLYKESGVNPAGCALTMIIQMPIWIALYQSIMLVLAVSPEGLLNLSRYLYNWPVLYSVLPLEKSFLGLDLATGNIILAILVGATMWIQQKMITPSYPDPRQQAQNSMMLWMMPLIFTLFSLSFSSGLALYWIVSNIFSIVSQYYVTGWGGLSRSNATPDTRDKRYKTRIAEVEERARHTPTGKTGEDSTSKEELKDERTGDKRPDSGGSDSKGSGGIGRWFGRR
jgi:YidC/Oxa1 family membrane protein insertase